MAGYESIQYGPFESLTWMLKMQIDFFEWFVLSRYVAEAYHRSYLGIFSIVQDLIYSGSTLDGGVDRHMYTTLEGRIV